MIKFTYCQFQADIQQKTYKGIHEPIIDPRIFKQAQAKLSSKQRNIGLLHNYLFRRKIRCGLCNYSLTGEKQKGKESRCGKILLYQSTSEKQF